MSKQLTVDIDRYQALADKCDGLEYQVELQAKRIAALEQAQRWIPVGERLPKDSNTLVIVVTEAKRQQITTYGRVSWKYLRVTHWLPLPKAPEVE